MPKGHPNVYYYECGFPQCKSGYKSPMELTAFPWCPSESHNKMMNFIEDESTRVPDHILQADIKKGDRLKTGGNWL